jgi:small subunit ribosomal protein S8
MSMTDPIADMLTRIRNAYRAKHTDVDVPASRIKREIAKLLVEEGYIKGVQYKEDGKQGVMRLYLKYDKNDQPVIKGIQRLSKPGRRVYKGVKDMPKVLNGLGIALVSTSHGVMVDRECRKRNIGGEVLCYVW